MNGLVCIGLSFRSYSSSTAFPFKRNGDTFRGGNSFKTIWLRAEKGIKFILFSIDRFSEGADVLKNKQS